MSHSKEPWSLCQCSPDCFNIYSDQNVVVGDEGLYSEANPNTEADALRIIACVNACSGIPTEQLERGVLEMPLLATLADIRRESGVGDGPMLKELAPLIGKGFRHREMAIGALQNAIGMLTLYTSSTDEQAQSGIQSLKDVLFQINGGEG